jgi:tRNA-modifying protein YgfZ
MVDLKALQQDQGATFEAEVPVSFANEPAAIQAAHQGVALIDRSHWTRIELTGRDRQSFLHNQSTNDINALKPGQFCDTVLVNSTARTLDLATGYVLKDSVLLLASPQKRQFLMQWFDRYIFFGDQIKLADLTDSTACFSLIGPASADLLASLGAAMPQENQHAEGAIAASPVRIGQGCGLGLEGATLWCDRADAGAVWQALSQTAMPLGAHAWEQLRIRQGRPAADQELTQEINALEAGLWRAVSFSKGCYIGQETIARLDTYNGVKQKLWGLDLTADPGAAIPGQLQPGISITRGSDKIGVVTSVAADGQFALGYVKTKAGDAGLEVAVDGYPARVVALPFITHEKVG